MNLYWLATFKEVIDAGGYTKAADALFISQSAVSQQVRQLERYFGAKLTRRVGQELQLTEAGKEVYAFAANFELELEVTSQKVRALNVDAQARVTVVSTTTPLLHYLPLALRRFWAEYPDVDVRTMVRFGADIPKALRSGEADLGIQNSLNLDAKLSATRVGDGEIIVVSRRDHPLAQATGLPLAEVANQRVAIPRSTNVVRKLVDDWFHSRGLKLQNLMEVASHEETRIAAREGLAIGVLTRELVQEDLDTGELVELDIADFELASPIFVTYAKDLHGPSRRLIQILTEINKGSRPNSEAVAVPLSS